MNIASVAQSAAPLELVTGEPEQGVFSFVSTWGWIALAAALLIGVSIILVRFLGRDRSHRAEAERAFKKIARANKLSQEDRRLVAQGARDASVDPVACLLSLGAFEQAERSVPAEFVDRFVALRRTLFPEAGAATLHA